MTIPELNIDSLLIRRADFTINAPIEKVVSIANNIKTFHKIMKNVESVTEVETIGGISVYITRGIKLNNEDILRESLIAWNTKKTDQGISVARTSIELDKAPALGSG